jgi:signal transduction histidine kinase
LQTFQGLLLHVEDATMSVQEAKTRVRLETALRVTQNALSEGREKIGQLRSLVEPQEELPGDITRLARRLGELYPIAFSMHIAGQPRAMNASAASDVHAIVGELVNNAFRHSQARSLHVEIHYGRRALDIVVTDDGYAADQPAALTRKSGHWGLQGMQERANRVGGRLAIGAAHTGNGTRATLKIPARFVYVKSRWLW